jgi:DNA-binding NarL/FixJ family response regulator
LVRSRRPPSSSADPPIRLVVVEPSVILGVGVREILDHEPDIEVVAHVRTIGEGISVIAAADPDVVLVDVELAEAQETEATRRLHQGAPESGLIVMGGDDAASIVGAVGVGATAHVASTAEPAQLVATIRRVADGEDPLKDELIDRPDLIERIIDGIRESIEAEYPSTHPLTPREFEVLAHAAAGSRNREIADTLGVTEQTVKNHLSSILHKLGVPNRTQAVMYAARQGWLALDDTPSEGKIPEGRR